VFLEFLLFRKYNRDDLRVIAKDENNSLPML